MVEPVSCGSYWVAAVSDALRGEDVTLATPTASGKILALASPGPLAQHDDGNAIILCLAPTRMLVE